MTQKQKIKALRSLVRWLVPLAEEIVGAYSPEQATVIRDDLKMAKRILRNTAT